jgi:hypothetical protein
LLGALLLQNDGSLTQNFGSELGTIITAYMMPMICIVAIVWALWIGVQWMTARDDAGRRNARNNFSAFLH